MGDGDLDLRFRSSFEEVSRRAYQNSVAKGFRDGELGRTDFLGISMRLALVHSEVSELLDGVRHGNPPSDHIPEFSSAEEEAADIIIRLMDLGTGQRWRIAEAILAKMAFNEGREHMHGGKKF